MLYNAERLTVWESDEAGTPDSTCPLCGLPLLARRGEIVVWHWAHRPISGKRKRCPWTESAWHLRWKYAYSTLPRWDAEVRLDTALGTWIIDAMNSRTGRVREFVHSLSPYYLRKHFALQGLGYDVLWIFDGHEFASKRLRHVAHGGVKRLLRPTANRVHDSIGGLVHWGGGLWKHWKGDVWYPVEGDASSLLLSRFRGE